MLRKSPTRTEAFLAANRRNALKSTGPRTARGKAWSCMNNLKHGRYCKRLPEKLAAAGDHGGAALCQKVRGEIATAFEAKPDDPLHTRQLDKMTTEVWLLTRQAGLNNLKPRCSLFSKVLGPAHQRRLLFRMEDRQRGIRISYWIQRKGYWNQARIREVLKTGRYPADAPTLGEILESKLRHRVFRRETYSPLARLQRLLLGLYEEASLSPPTGPGGLRPASGVRPSAAGASSDATRMTTAPGTVPASPTLSREEGSPGQTRGPADLTSTTSGGLFAGLARFLAKLLGGR